MSYFERQDRMLREAQDALERDCEGLGVEFDELEESRCFDCAHRPCKAVNRYFSGKTWKMSEEEYDLLHLKLHGLCDDFQALEG